MRRIIHLALALLFVLPPPGRAAFNPVDEAYLGFKNYIKNAGAEAGKVGFNLYADAAATSPADGTGGSATSTLTASSSSPLAGAYSLLFTKPASNEQGEGFSYDFTINSEHKAKALQVRFNYEVSANFTAGSDSATGSIVVYVYDVTNTTMIQLAPYKLTGGSTGGPHSFVGEFQTASNSTSYRLIWHVADSGSSTWTFKLDSLYLGTSARTTGPPVTDWVSYTPTSTWVSGATHTGFWRRVGDSMEVQTKIACTGGVTAAGLTLTVPGGFSIDTTKRSSSTDSNWVGSGAGFDTSGGSTTPLYVEYLTATTVRIRYSDDASPFLEARLAVDATNPWTWANGDLIHVTYKVPIAGWGSSVEYGSSADTRVVAARYTSATADSFTSGVARVINFEVKDYDTHSAVTTGADAWKFTAPVAGKYSVKFSIAWGVNNSATLRRVGLFKNGSIVGYLDGFYADTVNDVDYSKGSADVNLNAGDYIALKGEQVTGGALGLYANSEFNHIEISRVGGASAITASETMAARYTTAAGQSISNNTVTIVDFGTKDFDTHGSVTTGASWKFTAATAGKFQVSAVATTASGGGWAAGEVFEILLYKNGGLHQILFSSANQATHATYNAGSGSGTVSLVAGDYIDVRVYQNSGASLALLNSANYNHVSIHKIGGTP